MKTAASILAVLGLASAANAGVTLDDLSIGTIGAGSTMGDTTGASDDLNGASGFVLGGTWTGGDDVYTVNWGGGDFSATMSFTTADGDIDLYLWGDNLATTLLDFSEGTGDTEDVEALGLAAGTYYLAVDGWLGATNSYKIDVVPAPASAALLGLGGLVATRRRRA